MAGENDPFVTAIEAKIAAWQAVLDSYYAATAAEGNSTDGSVSAAVPSPKPRSKTPTDLPVGVFRDKSIKDAVLIYLEAGRRKQTNKEIADGLKKGGIATTSANFEPTVATALYRLKNEGHLLRFDDGWDLASSYPDSLRSRLENQERRRPVKPDKKRKAKRIVLRGQARPRAVSVEQPSRHRRIVLRAKSEPSDE